MAGFTLKNLRKAYGALEVIKGVDLEVADGEFVVFVGPSGCGKSTLLRMIAGLEEITSGELHIGDRLCNDVPAKSRGVSMVFQSYALYPHKTVYKNMSFGLQIARVPRDEIDRKVRAAAEILHIEPLLDRRPGQLSGGQRQRVAIGRAIVRDPAVFLFDEPLSNLDAALRVHMRMELAKLRDELGTTMVYVTHDQVEAMTLADRIVVLDGGIVQQVGSPLELYHRPANEFVAGFIGSPKMNFLPARVRRSDDSGILVSVPQLGEYLVPAEPTAAIAEGAPVTLGIRPENVLRSDGGVPCRIDVAEHVGNHAILRLLTGEGGQELLVQASGNELWRVGQPYAVELPSEALHLFDAKGAACKLKSTPRVLGGAGPVRSATAG